MKQEPRGLMHIVISLLASSRPSVRKKQFEDFEPDYEAVWVEGIGVRIQDKKPNR